MLLVLLISHYIIASVANPFHKYPYVFLLDVGNEELDKTNTEQIRITSPGGSLAIKYPAAGEGDIITHVRVSGIDFGTDLKANIAQGGPGYKYVVILFMGNKGVSYDAVVTLQTLPSGSVEANSIESNVADADLPQDLDGNNDDVLSSSNEETNIEYDSTKLQSSNVYEYAINQSEDNEDGDSESEGEQDIHITSSDDDINLEDAIEDSNESAKENSIEDEDGNDKDEPSAEKYSSEKESDNGQSVSVVEDTSYNKYEALMPLLYGKIYRQQSYEVQENTDSEYTPDDPVEFDQMFNDEEVHNDASNKDTNNNFDSDYGAVEY